MHVITQCDVDIFFFPVNFTTSPAPPLWLLVSLREVNKCTGVGCYSLPLLPCRAADSPLLSLSRLRRPFGNTSFLCGWVGTPTAFFHSPFHAVMKCASCSCEGILKGILCQCVSGWKSPAQRLPAKQTILTLSRPQQGGVGGGATDWQTDKFTSHRWNKHSYWERLGWHDRWRGSFELCHGKGKGFVLVCLIVSH